MLITSQQAEKLWCPMSMVSKKENTINREAPGASFPSDCRCIAEKCMWWVATGNMGFCGITNPYPNTYGYPRSTRPINDEE